MKSDMSSILNISPVMPVIVIEKLEFAVPLARVLYEGGLHVLEVTLRTSVALEAIRAIRTELPDVIVGAGTVINENSLLSSIDAGAQFIVSPGCTPSLVDAALAKGIPFLPGVSTPSEMMELLDRGITTMKFFPAEAAGGIAMLKAIGGPMPQISFCPTGGVNPDNAKTYLELDNVACVGGSWIAPTEMVEGECWEKIRETARRAAELTNE